MVTLPVYEYLCEKCGKRIEITHDMKDNKKRFCSSCGERIERIISLSSFKLKWPHFHEESKR